MSRKTLLLAMAVANIINFLLPVSMAVNPNCEYYQEMVLGQEYYIYNVEYPNYYPPLTSCRWTGRSAPGTNIIISCTEINLPSSPNCQYDRLSISLTGNPDFIDSHNFCGRGTVTLSTEANAITVGLFSPGSTPGGRFLCSLTAVQEEPPITDVPDVCDCGWSHKPRIVGGNDTGINEFPAMAGIVDVQLREVYCGGTILSDRYVITAVHCLTNKKPTDIGVLVGDHDTSRGDDTPYAALYKVIEFRLHPNYVEKYQWNDIAIVKTEKPIVFSMFVGPICIPFRYSVSDFYGETVTALGWGALGVSELNSKILQKVDLSIVSNSYCNQSLNDPIIGTQICTSGDNGKDSCTSDSGGPILWYDQNNNRYHLIGIISFGYACAAGRPAVNTRVTSYLNWIVQTTGDATYCIK